MGFRELHPFSREANLALPYSVPVAEVPGVEPGLTESKSVVLPLHYTSLVGHIVWPDPLIREVEDVTFWDYESRCCAELYLHVSGVGDYH